MPHKGVPQGSVLAPFSSTSTPPTCQTTVSRKYAYADDLAIMHADGDWLAVEGCSDQGHRNAKWITPDLEAKAQHYKNGVGSLPR